MNSMAELKKKKLTKNLPPNLPDTPHRNAATLPFYQVTVPAAFQATSFLSSFGFHSMQYQLSLPQTKLPICVRSPANIF